MSYIWNSVVPSGHWAFVYGFANDFSFAFFYGYIITFAGHSSRGPAAAAARDGADAGEVGWLFINIYFILFICYSIFLSFVPRKALSIAVIHSERLYE